MIKLTDKTIQTEKTKEEIIAVLEDKTIITKKTLHSTSTVNMVDNEKDFYGYNKNGTLYITRIRRIAILIVVPKQIIEISRNDLNKRYKIKLGLGSMFLMFFIIIALITNTYELIDTKRFTDDFKGVLILVVLFLGLLFVELKMYERKFKKYFGYR